jgi:hypothetical protein
MLDADADRRDTPRAAHWGPRSERRPRPGPIPAALAILLVTCAPAGRAAGERTTGLALAVDARVVWVSGDRVYLAARDSIALQPAMRLTLLDGDRLVATAEVSAVLDRALARARLLSGVLADTRHLDRLRILAEPPRAPALLRVGYPAPGRRADPFPCARTVPGFDPASHRIETVGRALRITRLPDTPAPTSWPDTLVVQPFDDPADEEIALERGEIEVAVFWPGELSARLREHPRWRDPLTASAAPGPDCPVVCDAGIRAQVAAIGARALLELYRCPESAR